MRMATAQVRMAGLSESVHAWRLWIVAFQTLCKQKYLAEGESVPFLLHGQEVLVVWALVRARPTKARGWPPRS